MNKRERDKIIENLLVAQAMIQDMPNHRLYYNLLDWANSEMKENGPSHCGSTACFGGWVAVHPHFRKQGVRPDIDGAPTTENAAWSVTVSNKLFGVDTMFGGGVRGDLWGKRNAEKREVMRRIKEAMENALS